MLELQHYQDTGWILKLKPMTLVLEFAVKTVAGTSQVTFNFKKVLSTNLIYVLHRLK